MVRVLESQGCNVIWLVVDRLSNMKLLDPYCNDSDGKKLGSMIICEGFRLHSLPDTIVSNRGPQYATEL
jgi:hypothetical protein